MLHTTNTPLSALVHAGFDRATLAVNHVLGAEPEATKRLQRHHGRVVDASAAVQLLVPPWVATAGSPHQQGLWRVTPAGLLERVVVELMQAASPSNAVPSNAALVADVTLELTSASLTIVTRAMLNGDDSVVVLRGDTALAADLRWVLQHVRWDFAGDIERVLPTAVAAPVARGAQAMAKGLTQGARQLDEALSRWWPKPASSQTSQSTTPPQAAPMPPTSPEAPSPKPPGER
jgi:ubiquinone biosynthesis accessory factor UbiJ